MTIAADTFELATYRNPFTDRAIPCEMREGVTVVQIVRDAGIDPRFMADVQVTISRGINAYTVPMSDWGKVRPKAGSHVLVHPREHGPAAPLLLSALLPHAASYHARRKTPSFQGGDIRRSRASAAFGWLAAFRHICG